MSPKRRSHKQDTSLANLASLTWEDLDTWTNQRTLSRASGYQKNGAVRDLVRVEEDQILARVQGGELYLVWVGVDPDGTIESQCSCPVTFSCKHAAAAILDAASRLKKGDSLPEIDKASPLYREFQETMGDGSTLDEAGFDCEGELGDDDSDDESWESADYDSSPKTRGRVDSQIEAHLETLSKPKLKALLLELSQTHSHIRQEILDKKVASSGNHSALVESLEKEISLLGEVHYDYRGGCGMEADTGRIETQLNAVRQAKRGASS